MSTEVISRSGKTLPLRAEKQTTSQVNDSIKDIFVEVAPKIIVFFVGGAGDKRPFLGSGPNNNITDVRDKFVKEFELLIETGEIDADPVRNYLGFYEIFGEENIKSRVLARIPSKDVRVFIIGHSLGAWNGAHLSRILSTEGYKVDLLVTLDPVGVRYNTTLAGADIYHATPRPIAQYWINLCYDGKTGASIPNNVATIGGRWDVMERIVGVDQGPHPTASSSPQRFPDVNATVSINHAFTVEAMLAKLQSGNNAWLIMKDRIQKIRSEQ
jgi:pimeloyl-ACP methyl ester carboxylesterase